MQSFASKRQQLMRDQLHRFLGGIVPSLIEFFNFLWRSLTASLLPWREETTKASPTAFLDGLRGYASLFVSFYHLRNGYTDSVHIGYGARPEATSVFQLPIVRLLLAGQQMVTIFFVVSGYSLALGTFKALKSGDVDKALERIRSSVFRRFLRLYLPTVASSFVVLCCISAGLYNWGHEMDERRGYREPEPEIFDSLGLQLYNWLQETAIFLDVFRDSRHLYYPHSWSIPTEFVKSIQLYLLLIALCKLKPLPRAILHLTGIAYCYYYGAGWLWTFLVGAGVAHLNIMLQDRWQTKSTAAPRWETAVKLTVFLVGLYVLSYPEWDGPNTPGFQFLTPLLPMWWPNPAGFVHTSGAALVIWSVSNTAWIRAVFSCGLARYFGRVSFALYLMHGIVIHVLGLWLLPMIWRLTGKETTLTMDAGYFIGLLAYVPVCLFCADMFTRLVDEPSVRFAKWLEGYLSAERCPAGEYQRLPLVELDPTVDA